MAAPPAIATTNAIAALISGHSWAGTTITYSIARADSVWPAYGGVGEPASPEYGTLADAQAQRFRDAMAVWDGLVARHFVETDDVTATGQIRVAATGTDFWGFAYFPEPDRGGDIWISRSVTDGSAFAAGTYDWHALLHEIGHAIGLKHPFEGPATLPRAYDNYRYSIMSYTPPPERVVTFSDEGGVFSTRTSGPVLTTPGLFDILAIQDLYGTDAAVRAGPTTYRFDPDDRAIQVIADPGGIDTFDLSAAMRPAMLDLREGAFSTVNLYTASIRIEDEVARYGEAFRSTITAALVSPDIFVGRDNVGIAYGTVIENARLGRADDSAFGNDAPNALWGGAGNDTLSGGDGADTLVGGTGDDRMAGNAGNDIYVVDSPFDLVVEQPGEGIDTVITWRRVHVLEAEVEVLLAATPGPARLLGNDADNTIHGGAHADTILGGEGNDLINGRADADRLIGGGGADLLAGGGGADTLFGGPGADRLWGQAGDDRMLGSAGDDVLLGGAGADTLFGMDGADLLLGQWGADSLLGWGGDDSLWGGTGDDTLIGGAGADLLTGGSGADVFRFQGPAEAGDVIRDFRHAAGDVISLGAAQFRHGVETSPIPGVTFIATAEPEAPSPEAAFLYDTMTGALRYDPDGTGPAATLLLATLTGAPTLLATDIVFG